MRCARALTLVLLMGALSTVAAPAFSQSRSFRISDVRIQAELRADGSLAVVEERTFRYQGTYFGAFYTLPLRGGQRVHDVALTDSSGTAYRPGVCRQDGDRQPGTYEIEQSGRRFTLTWCYHRPPTDEDRTSRIAYVVTQAATRHADAAELYWKWVGEGWDVATDRLVADLRLPAGESLVAGEDLLLWGHGPFHGRVSAVEPGVVRTEVDGLPPNTFVELRLLMPPDHLADAPSDGREVREAILAEEGCLAVAANAARARARGERPVEDCDPHADRHRLANALLLAGLVGGGAAWGGVFLRHGREHALPPGLADYERDVPSEHPPAVVDWLLRWGSVGDQALVATIMDLARRGHIRIEQETVQRERLLRSAKQEQVIVLRRISDPGPGFERDVMKLLFTKAGADGAVSDATLKQWVTDNRASAYSWWQSWTKAVARDAKRHHWIESKGWMAASILLGFAVAGVAIGLAVVGAAWPLVALGVAAGVTMLAASPLMRRRTVEGRTLHHRWKRFGAFLSDYSLMPERGPEHLPLWGRYLVYAIPLGIAEQVMRNLDARLSAAELQQATGGWYPLGAGRDGSLSLAGGLGALGAAIPSSSIASSPSSSSSGGGGGFSGGGGGGGGGSGGGSF